MHEVVQPDISESASPSETKPRQWPVYLIAGCLYLLIAIPFTYPQIRILDKGFAVSPVGSSSDYNIVMWDAWWMKKALIDLRTNPFHTSYLFYPHGANLALHELTPLNSILTIPFQLLMNKPAGIILGSNIAILLTFVIAGLGMFALTKYLIADSFIAFFGGAAFAFCPYRTMHIVHTDLLSMGWIPLYMLFLFRILREKKMRYALYAALCFAAAVLTCNVYAYFLILVTGFFYLYVMLLERKQIDRRAIQAFLALSVVIGLVLLPRFLSILHSSAAIKQPEWTVDMLSANIAGFLLPTEKHLFYRYLFRLLPDFTYYLSGVPGHATFLTLTVIALAGIALAKVPLRTVSFWLALIVVFAVLSLGPKLHAGKWTTSLSLPYFVLYKYLPFFGIMRTPYRFIVLAEIGIITLAGFGLKEVVGGLAHGHSGLKGKWRYGIAGGFTILLLLELWNIPFNKYFPPVPAIYQKIAREEGEFAVLDVPVNQYSLLTNYMYYQTLHEKPISTGVLSRVDPALEQFRLKLNQETSQTTLSPEEADRLRELKIKYVLYHQPEKPEEIIAVLKLYE